LYQNVESVDRNRKDLQNMTKRVNPKTDGNDVGEALTIKKIHGRIGEDNITRQALYLAVARGELPSIRLGRRILIPRAPFEAWLRGSRSAA
jgi:excisionase family DNA binding protein